MVDLFALADRVENLTGPNRNLDCEIGVAVGWFKAVASRRGDPCPDYYDIRDPECTTIPGHGGDQLIPYFTVSLDSAMTLAPEGHAWTLSTLGLQVPFRFWASVAFPNEEAGHEEATASAPALALTAACLRARSKPTDGS